MDIDEANANISAEDLALLGEAEDGDGHKGGDDPGDETGDKTDLNGKGATDGKPAKAADETDLSGQKKGAIATGDELPPKQEPEGYWPDGWREKMAEYAAAGDARERDRLLRQLGRYVDPAAIFAKTRELESKFSAGGLIKVPGKDAKPEDIADFHKALGVPEKPAEYIENIHLENGAVIGDADKPMLDEMLGVAHKAGATQPVVDAIVNWYYRSQEAGAADLDQSDDTFRRESEAALKEEYGSAFKRNTNAIAPLFSAAPGGADVTNNESLYARLMGGRMADGRVIGNDTDMVRFLVGLAQEVNPAATITEDGDQSGKSITDELTDLRKLQKDEPKKYWSKETQARELELIAAQQKLQAKA